MAKHQKPLRRIGVYCSGGDAPGMNAALRAVVRMTITHQLEMYAIPSGYVGMIEGGYYPLTMRDMANIIQRGGTIIKTGRSAEFQKAEGRKKAAEQLKQHNIDGLVCIGGNGSFAGAHLLWEEHQIPITGVPGTIDNDIFGSDNTIGFDTAVNTALEAIDRIRDTAASHDRLFIVEVMGRNSGFIAAQVGLAGGAEEIFTPDFTVTVDQAIEKIKSGMAKGKRSSILITAEGQKSGRAYDLAEAIRKKSGFDAKVCILGHQQRGGSPTATDRILASRLGAAAVETLISGDCDVMLGIEADKVVKIDFATAIGTEKKVPSYYLKLASILSQ
jgi:6-phosphofructokinase 1